MSDRSPSRRPPPRRPRHLMDPDAPRPAPRGDPMSLTSVQRWVLSVLATSTVLHLSAGLVVAAYFLQDPRPGAQAGLLVIAGAFGTLAVALGFLINARRPLTPWVVLGWVPALVGAYLIFWR